MRQRIPYRAKLCIGFCVLMFICASAGAFAEDFYKGKTIRFIVGNAPGGGYDTYTRTAARYISKYIPGNPTPIVQNMTGAGSLVAANYVGNKAKPNGLTVGIWNNQIILQKVLGEKKVRFDPKKLGWIGAPVKGVPTCAVMGFTGLKTLKDVLNSNKPLKMGATRAGSTTYDFPHVLNRLVGTKFDVISGYTGTATIRIAMQKGEVDGACWGWESMIVTARAMLDAKGDEKLIPFLTEGHVSDPEVKDLPQVSALIKGKDKLATFNAWYAPYEFQRPLSLPPGTPKARLETLRKGYKAALNDPGLLAEAKKSQLKIDYVSGQQIEKYVDVILATPVTAKEGLGFLVRRKKK